MAIIFDVSMTPCNCGFNVWQVKYAALDALLTGMLFRALEEMHFAGKACQDCKTMLGIELPAPNLACSCGKVFRDLSDLRAHAAAMSHACNADKCYTCGRLMYSQKEAASASASVLQPEEGEQERLL